MCKHNNNIVPIQNEMNGSSLASKQGPIPQELQVADFSIVLKSGWKQVTRLLKHNFDLFLIYNYKIVEGKYVQSHLKSRSILFHFHITFEPKLLVCLILFRRLCSYI